jgi:hypothetical protein
MGLVGISTIPSALEWKQRLTPHILSSCYLYLGAVAQERAFVFPWPCYRRRSRHSDVAARREAPVSPAFVNDTGIVDPRDIAGAWRWVRVHLSKGMDSAILRNGRGQAQAEEQRQECR